MCIDQIPPISTSLQVILVPHPIFLTTSCPLLFSATNNPWSPIVLTIWGYPPGLKQSTSGYVLTQNDSMSPSLNQLPVSPLTGLEPLGPISICAGILIVFILDRCWKGTCSCCELMHATAMSCLEISTSQHFSPFASAYILFLPFLQCFLSLE